MGSGISTGSRIAYSIKTSLREDCHAFYFTALGRKRNIQWNIVSVSIVRTGKGYMTKTHKFYPNIL